MKNEKAFQKNLLIYEFGILMQPLEDLARAEQPPSLDDYRIAIAKVQGGERAWRQQVRQLTQFASDISFVNAYGDISHVPERCCGALNGIIENIVLQNDPNELKVNVGNEVTKAQEKFITYIDRIPMDWEPVVFEANTPFTSYLRIKESIVSVKRRLHYFDRYLKPDFFELFLASIDKTVSIRLVTTAGTRQFGVAGVAAVSRLARQEFDDFELIEVKRAALHDRNLRVDAQVFSLGPGVDQAGIALTNFEPADSSSEAHTQFDRIIADGQVVQ